MAATIHGSGGKVKFGTDFTYVANWTITATVDIFDTTVMSASDVAKSKIKGFTDFTATVDGLGTTGAAEGPEFSEGTEATLELHLEDGTLASGYFSGNAICIGVTAAQDPSGAGTFTYEFQGSGALDWKTAA